MSLLCQLGLHAWKGTCTCSRCGVDRGIYHVWNGCRCSVCKTVRDVEHHWEKNCERCSECGRTRRDFHYWQGCTCAFCGQTRDQQHDWSHDETTCFRCGRKLGAEDEDELVREPVNKRKSRFSAYDNVGTRVYTFAEVQARTKALLEKKGTLPPHLNWWFSTREQAMDALLSVPCIKLASESSSIICVEPLEYGVYETTAENDPRGPFWNALLRGNTMTYDLFKTAEDAFFRHAGRKLSAVEPDPSKRSPEVVPETPPKSDVVFLHEIEHFVNGVRVKRRMYRAPNQDSALAFLRENPVEVSTYYLEVETPEGRFGRSVQGIYLA